jgi:hypothetical protein
MPNMQGLKYGVFFFLPDLRINVVIVPNSLWGSEII